jgi:phage nucleotide-binding protein
MYLNILVYGEPGVGKTTFAAKSPNALIVDFESGTLSVRNFDLAIANPRTLEEVVKVIKKAEKKGIETLIIDSVTEMQRVFMNEVMESMSAKDPRKSLFSPTLEAWGMVTEMMRYVIRAARDADMNTVFIALETQDRDESTGHVMARPSASPKVAGDLSAYVDIIGRLRMKKDKREMSFAPTDSQWAKDRSGLLPAAISGKDLSFQYVIDTVNNGIEVDEPVEEDVEPEKE